MTANGDTLFHTIPPFAFLDQDSALITEADFEGKVYITDFFFTSCPSICPKMKSQMIRIHDEFWMMIVWFCFLIRLTLRMIRWQY
ncbi:MAG: SCO family protein [Bacteroidia bacterium]